MEHAALQTNPLYQQIRTLIVQSLQEGAWPAGAMIPSEIELAKRYGVSQGTVRKAIDELVQENFLKRRQGKGTFVSTHNERQVQYRFLRLAPDHGNLADKGGAERYIHSCQVETADSYISHTLHLQAQEQVVHIIRTLYFSQQPVILEHIWLSATTFGSLNLATMQANKRPMYAMFEMDFGISMVKAEEKIKAVAADAAVAQKLALSPGSPCLFVERLSHTYHNKAVELRQAWYNTLHFHYANSLT